MKQAPKKMLASLLSIVLVLSCVIIPGTFVFAQADSIEASFATNKGLSVGETLINEDYSSMAKGTAIPEWVVTTGGTDDVTDGSNGAALGFRMRKNNGKRFYTRALPAGNFVAKFTAYSTYGNTSYIDNYIGIANSATADDSNATYIRIFKDYIADNKTRNFANGSSLGYSTLSDKYDLDDLTKGYTFYIFAVNGKYYFVDLDGNTLFTYEGAASHFFLSVSYSEMTMTEFSVYELIAANGTEESPYIIKNAEDLKDAIGSFGGGSYYKLANDIYLNDVDAINWTTGTVVKNNYTPNEWFTTAEEIFNSYLNADGESGKFSGTIDGNGYCIYGLWYPEDVSNSVCAALIPVAGNATICNLGIKNSFIKGHRFAGGIVGANYSGDLSLNNVFVDDTVSVIQSEWNTSYYAGGLMGYGQSGTTTINNCYSAANISSYKSTTSGGLFGCAYLHTITVQNCYSYGHAPYSVIDSNRANVFNNLYSDTACDNTTLLTDAQIKGANALANMTGFSDDVWYSVKNDTKTPMLRINGIAMGDVDEDSIGKQIGDLAAIRKTIINTNSYKNSDFNRDGYADVLDLVSLKRVLTESNDNYSIVTISGNSVAYNYTDWVNPDGATIYYQSGYASAANELADYYSATYGINNIMTAEGEYESGKAIVLKSDDSLEAGSAKTYVENNVFYFVAGSDTLENQSNLNTMGTAVKYFKAMKAPVNMAASFAFSLSENDSATKTVNGKTYYYTWGDEFNGNVLDSTKWTTGVVRMSAIVGTLSDAEDCIKVSNGKLTLRNYKNASGEYVQPRAVQTTQKMNFRYGYVEITAKAPFQKQIWPSFWMLSVKTETLANRAAPYRGILNSQMYIEYDVFEVMGSRCTLDTTFHKHYRTTIDGIDYRADTSVNNAKKMCNKNHDYAFLGAKDHSTESHVYGFEWTPEVVRIYLDGTKIYEQSITKTFDTQQEVDTSTQKNGGASGTFNSADFSAFHDPQQLIFNNHFQSGITGITGFTESLYEIEYVRVYQDKTMNDEGVAYGKNNVLYSGIWTN